ncbi:LysR family transcriptional regulator [Amphritea balenae]|uniref:LysR family transcriptional regulator n=1 Tax=Amphritea balenae TaxID=452629 RepID=A0A3P1SSS1_9GAMM|nr:LysR family transcriptional regulator [Amphritea balenae]RRD00100.1 LysR family transcriptional regulator [Amphritea balenae]GGK76614.1 LysR family transcriptional regulator [Amphritea balenae]
MDKLNLMTSFIAVAEAGSFTAAARQLGKTKALVSTHVSQLEEWLKVRLIIRSTRSMMLTPEGQSYYEQAKKILDDVASLEADLLYKNQSLVGRLRISAPTTFGELVLMPFIAQMTADNPELNIDLMLNDRYVDLIGEGFDMGIRIGKLEDSSLIARSAGDRKMTLCATAGFIDRFGLPEQLEQLSEMPCVFDSNFREGAGWSFHRDDQEVEVKPRFVARVNSALAAANMARTGAVIANCPDFAVQSLIEQGELIPLFEEHPQRPIPVNIIYPHRQHLSTKVKTFTDGLINYLAR